MTNPLLSTATRNAITKAARGMNLEFGLRNIVINGQKRGCSGWIHDPDSGNTVYVNTEPSCVGLTYLVRSAPSKEICGGSRDGANYHEKDLKAIAQRVVSLLRQPHFITDWQQHRIWANAQYIMRQPAPRRRAKPVAALLAA